jgi:hypothetical protein
VEAGLRTAVIVPVTGLPGVIDRWRERTASCESTVLLVETSARPTAWSA